MRKIMLLIAALLVVPVFASAQDAPDSIRARRDAIRGRMAPALQDMTPEQRAAYTQGFRHGRMTAARAALGRGPGMRGMGLGDGIGRGVRGAGMGIRGMGIGTALRTELGLTDAQVKKLDEIRAQQRALHLPRMEALRNDREKWQEQRELFQQQTRALMLEVLTPEQRTKFEALEQQAPAPRRGRW